MTGGSHSRGNSSSFEQEVEQHRPSIRAFLLSMRCHASSVDDLTQDTICKALLATRSFDESIASLKTWLFAIAKNAMRSELRRLSRSRVQYVASEELDSIDADVLDPAAHVEAEDSVSHVHRQLENMNLAVRKSCPLRNAVRQLLVQSGVSINTKFSDVAHMLGIDLRDKQAKKRLVNAFYRERGEILAALKHGLSEAGDS